MKSQTLEKNLPHSLITVHVASYASATYEKRDLTSKPSKPKGPHVILVVWLGEEWHYDCSSS